MQRTRPPGGVERLPARLHRSLSSPRSLAVPCLLGVTVMVAPAAASELSIGQSVLVMRGERPVVKVAEVSSRVDPASVHVADVTGVLRRNAEAELGAIDWDKEGVRRGYVVSASVTHLASNKSSGALTANCTVSATLRDAARGTILAIVHGRALAEESAAGDPASAERGALRGAVRGAISALPEAIRKTEQKL
jgi:hypothetical protein